MPREMLENERSTAINPSEAVEEKVSLSDRFGLWIGFHNCSQDAYLDMVRAYAAHYRLGVADDELDARGAWPGRSPAAPARAAWPCNISRMSPDAWACRLDRRADALVGVRLRVSLMYLVGSTGREPLRSSK